MVGTVEWKVPSFSRSAEKTKPGAARKIHARGKNTTGPSRQHNDRKTRSKSITLLRQLWYRVPRTTGVHNAMIALHEGRPPRPTPGHSCHVDGRRCFRRASAGWASPVPSRHRRRRDGPPAVEGQQHHEPSTRKRANAHKMLVLPAFCAANSQGRQQVPRQSRRP